MIIIFLGGNIMLMFIFSIVLLFASYSLWKGFLAFEDVLDFNEELNRLAKEEL